MTEALTALALSHADVLRQLRDAPDATPWTIANNTGRLVSNVRRDMPRLEKDGLVKDGRLTAKARAALDVLDGSKTAPRPGGIIGVAWSDIAANPHNPRKSFDPQKLEDLSDSILIRGLLQNLVVRAPPPAEANGVRFWIVAGERRWRAIGLAIERGEWPEERLIACKVTNLGDLAAAETALVENLVRESLSPIEEAFAFKELHEVHGVSTADIGRRIGSTQRFVQQRLQLLELDETSKTALAAGLLKVEDARRLVARPKQQAQPDLEPTPLLDEIEARGAAPKEVVVAATPSALNYPGAVEVLSAIARLPNQSAGSLWSGGGLGVHLAESAVYRRMKGLAAAGLVSGYPGVITDAGRAALAAVDGEPCKAATGVGAPAIALPRDEPLLEQVQRRLAAAQAAVDRDGMIMSDIRRVAHAELWDPPVAVAFLQLVLKALGA